MKTEKSVYINRSEKIKYSDMTDREKEIFDSLYDNPPVWFHISMVTVLLLIGMCLQALTNFIKP